MQERNFCVANIIVLNEICVYHERVYSENVVSKVWSVRFTSSQHYPNLMSIVFSEIVTQGRTENSNSRFINSIARWISIFLRPSRHFNCYKNFAVIMRTWISVFMASAISVMKSYRLSFRKLNSDCYKHFHQKTWNFPLLHFGTSMGRLFPKWQPLIDLPDSVFPAKSLNKASPLSGNSWTDALEANSIANEFVVKWLWWTFFHKNYHV